MSVQIIEREGKPEYAVLPYNDYLNLLELAEDVRDAADAIEAMRELPLCQPCCPVGNFA
ncbi:hypothetical protein [Marinobacter sp.]|uniref:hypothetical protein n=1 Tax=Marinobacter sp. TaxID=50741 RepID=UPI003A8D2857